jgi:hypothetical protein
MSLQFSANWEEMTLHPSSTPRMENFRRWHATKKTIRERRRGVVGATHLNVVPARDGSPSYQTYIRTFIKDGELEARHM